jgi:hypothetical protein
MCPTELLFDASRPPSIQLLPIETRLKDATVQEFRNYADEWTTFELDLSNASKMSEALARVSEVKTVPIALARALGLQDEPGLSNPLRDGDARVDVPAWRHAIINFPHPLLQQGLVVLDTPGLNAVGAEPELTLSQLPNAQAVLFVLAADTGVTKSDLEVWKRDLGGDDPQQKATRLVVLNKIDSLWDGLKSKTAIAAEIAVRSSVGDDCSDSARRRSFPCPRRRARRQGQRRRRMLQRAACRRSRMRWREAHSGEARHRGQATQSDGPRARRRRREILEARQASIAEQLADLRELRGKNQDVVAHMMTRVNEDKEVFERSVQRFGALRTVFAHADQRAVRRHRARGAARERGAHAPRHRAQSRSPGHSQRHDGVLSRRYAGISTKPRAARRDPRHDAGDVYAIRVRPAHPALHAAFLLDAQIPEGNRPPGACVQRALQHAVEHAEQGEFSLTRGFFETVASRVKHVYDVANRELEPGCAR